jgi:hypothetical protein
MAAARASMVDAVAIAAMASRVVHMTCRAFRPDGIPPAHSCARALMHYEGYANRASGS